MKQYKILLATKSPFAADAVAASVEIIKKAGLEIQLLEKYGSKQDLLKAVADVQGLIVRSDDVDAEVIEAAPQLKLVIRGGAGYNNIDVESCTAKGITVMNTPGQNSNAVAELAFGLMFSAVRHIVRADISTKQGEFIKSKLGGTELRNKKLGIHGFGYIGQLLARKAMGCDMKIYAYDPWVSAEKARDIGVTLVESLEELYKDADFISLHIPKNKNTENSINYSLLSLMKPTGVLVNTARSEVVNHEDLKKLMNQRTEFKYASDVHPGGDVPGEKEMAVFSDRVILTPHIGASTDEANFDTLCAAAQQAVEFFLEGKMSAAVNKDAVPYWLLEYATLARYIGILCTSMSGGGQPRDIQVICYSELEQYRKPFTENVLKGIYRDYDDGLTPQEAMELALQNGVTIKNDTIPDNTRGHGNSITVDYTVKFDSQVKQVSVRGTITDKMLKISRVNEFKNIDFQPHGLMALFEYTEKEGLIDIIGEHFTKAGYNKKQGRFIQSPDGDKQIIVFEVEKKCAPDVQRREVAEIAKEVLAKVSEVYNSVAVRFS